MDASQPLTIESFSYSWLVNLKPSQEGLDSSLGASFESADEASFIEMDPRCKSSSKRENSRTQASRNCVYPADSSPRMSSTSSVDYWRRSCDSDSSIYEAVLHCKRSFGK
ncbi:hypothetical protein CRG98_016146 [Punica granatum]|uniref:Membrane-associated kinase regulator 6 n=1 Tax=Punica granatum TaxID=22663 RepID=A0A2I0K4K3_PUNGR|nr:hypothetical protein CRG98_016146 [Punica granatum]